MPTPANSTVELIAESPEQAPVPVIHGYTRCTRESEN
jgi:hypothetical protein